MERFSSEDPIETHGAIEYMSKPRKVILVLVSERFNKRNINNK
jgi:hypothetical protein